MSIQPLQGNSAAAYTPQTVNRPSTETTAATPATAGVVAASAERKTVQAEAANRVEQDKPVDKDAVKDAVHKANQTVAGLRSDLKFTVDDDTGSNVVKFIDVKTKEVIRQIPAQEMLVIAKHLDDLQGLLIKERA
jgi:flagellar protein FlaG